MTMITYLLDSDIIIEALKGRAPATGLLALHSRSLFAMSAVTFGEVYAGIYYGRDPHEEENVFRAFSRGVRTLDINRTIARRYAQVFGLLRQQGQLIPAPDLLIAATALTYNLTLVTYNRRHFTRVPGLTIAP